LHLVGILFPHINDDARSKSHQKRDSLFIVFLARDYTGCAESPCGRVQEGCYSVIEVSYLKHFKWHTLSLSHVHGCHFQPCCNRQYCAFTLTSTPTYILLPTGGQGFLHVLYISIAYVLHQFRKVFAILQSDARSLFSK